MGLTKEQLIAAAWSLSGFSKDADVHVTLPGEEYYEYGDKMVSTDWRVERYYEGNVGDQVDFPDDVVVIRALLLKALEE